MGGPSQPYVPSDDDDAFVSDDDDLSFGFDPGFTSVLAVTAEERLAAVPGAGAERTAAGADVETGEVADPSVGVAPLPPAFLVELTTSARAQCTRFNSDGSLIATGCEDGAVVVHHTATGQPGAYRFDPKVHGDDEPGMCTALRFVPASSARDSQNVAIVASSSGRIWHWHATTGRCLGARDGAPMVEADGNQIYALDVRGDGACFATAGYDGVVRVYDEATHKLKTTLKGEDGGIGGHTNRVFGLRYVRGDANVLVSGGWDNTLQVWDERCGTNSVRQIFGPHVCGDAIDVVESAGGTNNCEILVGSWRDTNALQVWDIGSGRLVQDIPFGAIPGEKNCKLYSARFGKMPRCRGLVFAGGCGSNEARVIDRDDGRCVARVSNLAAPVHSVDLSPNELIMAVTCADGVQLYSVPSV